jgi:hypothetical protein
MNRVVVFSVLAIPVLTLSAAAGENLATLKSFEAAFRHGHAKSSIAQLESLVCWDNTPPETRNGMYRALAAGFSYVIARIEVQPFVESAEPYSSPPDWSVKPTREFVVWYADDVGQPPFPIRYPVGKRDGKFKFAMVVKSATHRKWTFPAPPPPTPVKSTDNPYLERFMSGSFKLVERSRDIDRDVFALLRKKIGSRLRFAERDEAFQLSDVVPSGDETLPDRRLVLAGHDGDIWFIKYVHGGFSPYGVLVIFSRENQNWRIAFTACGEFEPSTLEDIRRGIELGYYFRGGDGLY